MKKLILILVLIGIIISNNIHDNPVITQKNNVDVVKLAPPSLRVYYRLKQYSKEYDIPFGIALRVALKETGYRNPFNFNYQHDQVSFANAYGPVQVQLRTARWFFNDDTIQKEDLLYNIDFNIKIGMSYLRSKYDIYGDWLYALGYYNTGYKKINDYAINIFHAKI